MHRWGYLHLTCNVPNFGCRAGSQHMAQSSQPVPMSAEHTNALQPPAQHMMPQASSSPSLQRDSSPAPMAVQMAPSMSGDMDMDNVESSADSVIPSMSLQVCQPHPAFPANYLNTPTCFTIGRTRTAKHRVCWQTEGGAHDRLMSQNSPGTKCGCSSPRTPATNSYLSQERWSFLMWGCLSAKLSMLCMSR